jgi:aspartate aminotransferase
VIREDLASGISRLAASISPSPTLKTIELARQLRASGEAVINLAAGEPDHRAPRGAIDAGVAVLETGLLKYGPTAGVPSLRSAVVDYTASHYGRQVHEQNVLIAAGAKQALWNLLFTVTDPGDETIVLAPYWVSYPEMIRMVGGVPVIVQASDGGLQPSLSDIRARITPRTRTILLNSPNNPSGLAYDAEALAGLVELAEQRRIWLVCDDIYHGLLFDGRRPLSAWRYTEHDVDESHIVVVNGVSKLYGMTGLRIGWVTGPKLLIAAMTNVQAQTLSCLSTVNQMAADGALRGSQSGVEAFRSELEANRNLMLRELASIDGVTCAAPQGTFYCFPDFRAYRRDSLALANFLVEKARVVTVAGREFGVEGHLRLSYVGSATDIVEGVRRIRWALDTASPSEIAIGDRTATRDWT